MTLSKIFTLIACITIFTTYKENKTAGVQQAIIGTGKMPSVSNDGKGNIHLVFGRGDSIMYTFSSDKGVSFSAPILVDTLVGLVASSTRGPQLNATKDGITIIAVNEEGNIFSFYKEGAGNWLKTAINDIPGTDKEGFLGLSGDAENNLFAIWPDLRNDKHNRMYGARSADGGKSWSKNMMIYTSPDSTICECCKPSVVMKGSHVYVMFRNFIKGNRDLYLVQSSDAGLSFGAAQKLGKGSWPLNGCPMDGGGLAINTLGIPQTVWRRENKIYTCEPGSDEKEIAEGRNCTVETAGNKNIYAFTAGDDVYYLLPGGKKHLLGKGSLPVIKAINDNAVLCVWQDNHQIKKQIISL